MPRFILPRTVVRNESNAVQHIVESIVTSRFHWMFRQYDIMIVDHFDATAKRAYLRRTGDAAPNNGLPYGVAIGYTPVPLDEVIVAWTPTGPFLLTKLQ